MGAVAEKAGIPAVSIVAKDLADLAHTAAQVQGLPSMAVAKIPIQVLSGTVDVRPSCKEAVEEIIYGLTEWKPPAGTIEEWHEIIEIEGRDYQDAVYNMNALFISQRWSDGLPLMPPTKERVEWMLSGTCVPANKVFSTGLTPRFSPITTQTIAINAVMAVPGRNICRLYWLHLRS